MKILVLEWDVSRFSGRMATMVRFADAFKMLGHEVKFCSNWSASEIEDKESIFHYHQIKHLKEEDFSWNLDRNYKEVPEEWRSFDFIFAPYVGYGHLSVIAGAVPTVCWWISKQDGWSDKTLEFWTNSGTTKTMLRPFYNGDNLHVVVPPYNYSVFREKAKRLEDRKFDIAYLTRADPNKNIEEFCKVANRLDLQAVVGVLIKNGVQRQYVTELKRLYKGNVTFFLNADKDHLSTLLSNTKVYFHPSKEESCSIAIYEALNAGCFPVVYNVGAAREQLSRFGIAYTEAPGRIIEGLLKWAEWNPKDLVNRGLQFDLVNNLDTVEERLGQIEGKLRV